MHLSKETIPLVVDETLALAIAANIEPEEMEKENQRIY